MRSLLLLPLLAVPTLASAQTVALGARTPLERLPTLAGGSVALAAGPGALRMGLWRGAASATEGQLCPLVVGLPCPPLHTQDLHTAGTVAYLLSSRAGAGLRVHGGPVAGLRRRQTVRREKDVAGRTVERDVQWIPGAGAVAGVRVPVSGRLRVLGELELAAERRTVTWYERGAGMQEGRRWEPAAYVTLGLAYQR